MHGHQSASQWSGFVPKAANPSEALYKSLRLPRSYPKVAQWLFSEPHLPFHSNGPILSPHAFTGSVAIRAYHSFENISPVFDPFGVDEQITPHVIPASDSPAHTADSQQSPKPASYIIDLLFTPVARATSGIIVGYSLTTGQAFDPQITQMQSGTFRGKDHLNGRFAYDMDNDHLIIVINSLTPLVSGIIDLSFLGQSRHRYFYTVPNAPYGPHRLPSRVLVMLSGLEIKVMTPENGAFDQSHLSLFNSEDDSPTGWSTDPPDFRLRDGDLYDEGAVSWQRGADNTLLKTPQLHLSSQSLSRNYAEQLSEIVSDLHHLAISMQGVYKGPFMRRDVFDLFDPKTVRSSINGKVAGAHLPPTREYRRTMAIYGWQGYSTWAFGLRSQRREATLSLSPELRRFIEESRTQQTLEPPSRSNYLSEEDVQLHRRNAMTQTDQLNPSIGNFNFKDCQNPAVDPSFPQDATEVNSPLTSRIGEGMTVDPLSNNIINRKASTKLGCGIESSCTAWTTKGRDVRNANMQPVVNVETLFPNHSEQLVNQDHPEQLCNQKPDSTASHVEFRTTMNPTAVRAGIGTFAGTEAVPVNHGVNDRSRLACTPTLSRVGDLQPSLPTETPTTMAAVMPVDALRLPTVSVSVNLGDILSNAGAEPLTASRMTISNDARHYVDNGRPSVVGLCTGHSSMPKATSSGSGKRIEIPISRPIAKECRTCHWCNGLIGRENVALVDERMIRAEKLEARKRKNRESAMRSIRRRKEREERQERELADFKEKLVKLTEHRSNLLAENQRLRNMAALRGIDTHGVQVK